MAWSPMVMRPTEPTLVVFVPVIIQTRKLQSLRGPLFRITINRNRPRIREERSGKHSQESHPLTVHFHRHYYCALAADVELQRIRHPIGVKPDSVSRTDGRFYVIQRSPAVCASTC